MFHNMNQEMIDKKTLEPQEMRIVITETKTGKVIYDVTAMEFVIGAVSYDDKKKPKTSMLFQGAFVQIHALLTFISSTFSNFLLQQIDRLSQDKSVVEPQKITVEGDKPIN